eukprot:6590958-Ditylum_brightwellii.AAC.1
MAQEEMLRNVVKTLGRKGSVKQMLPKKISALLHNGIRQANLQLAVDCRSYCCSNGMAEKRGERSISCASSTVAWLASASTSIT